MRMSSYSVFLVFYSSEVSGILSRATKEKMEYKCI